MFSLILKTLLSTSLLAHTVLGCCWHHAHGQEHAAEIAPHAHCHAGHTADEGHAVCDDTPLQAVVIDVHDHSAHCDEPDCTFVNSGSPQPVLTQPSALAVLLTPASMSVPAQHMLDRAADPGSTRVSGAALRAALQVWLT